MNKEKETTPIALEFAGFWRRLGATIMDLIFLSIPFWIAGSAWGFGFNWLNNNGSIREFTLPNLSTLVHTNFLLLYIGISIIYIIGFWVWRGQTPGKMLLGIKIIRTDCSNINLGYAFVRYIGYYVSFFLLGIGFLWIGIDSRKQGFHDKIANTYVIILPKPPKVTAPQPTASA